MTCSTSRVTRVRRRGTALAALVVASALLFAAAGRAEARPSSAILAYGKVGALIPVTKLGAHVSLRLGAGYVLPVLKQRLAAVLDLGYSQCTASETLQDPRLGTAGGSYEYTMVQRDLNLFLGPLVFLRDPYKKLVPYASAGLDLHFLRSDVDGTGEQAPLGENEETSTKAGFALRGGAGYRLGPGMLTGELTFAWAPIDHDITGEKHLGRFALLVGYTAMLGL